MLPNELSYADGAQIACGFGTVYEGLQRIGISGTDAVLVMGLGPVGLAALQLSKALGARKLIGIDINPDRVALAQTLGLLHHGFVAGSENVQQVLSVTDGKGCEKTVDCSGNKVARHTCIDAARQVSMSQGHTYYHHLPSTSLSLYLLLCDHSGARSASSERDTTFTST